MSTRAIVYLERGLRVPFPDTIHRLAEALGLAQGDLSTLPAAARVRPDQRADAAPSPVAGLPQPLTSLVGREREVARVGALLAEPGVRLVTLTGPGGVGKTRLALQVATEAAHTFADGAAFVALAGLREPGPVVPAIAQALGVREVGDEPLAILLAGYLQRRHLLLLDNFEQVGAAAPAVGALLAACPGLVGLDADFAGALGKLAWIESCRGEHERAVRLAQENLAMLRKMGGRGPIAYGLMILGGTVHARGEEARARTLFRESLGLCPQGRKSWSDKCTIVPNLAGLARLALAQGQGERAVVLYGASEAYRASAPLPLAPPEEGMRDRVLAAARLALGEDAFETAWAMGQAMPLDEAIALACEDGDADDR